MACQEHIVVAFLKYDRSLHHTESADAVSDDGKVIRKHGTVISWIEFDFVDRYYFYLIVSLHVFFPPFLTLT